jgi:hypothetical protein
VKKELEGGEEEISNYHMDCLTGAGSKAFQNYSEELRDIIVRAAEMKAPQETYCKYNVSHVFKSLKERDTHEVFCPEKAAYDRKNAQT